MGDLISSIGSFIGTPGGAATIGGLGSVAGALIGSNASQSAANTQSQSANQALGVQSNEFAQTRADLSPYNQTGTNALTGLSNPGLEGMYNGGAPYNGGAVYMNGAAYNNGQPFSMSQSALEQTPGYQFNMSQGLEATQNAAAARGLGVSGAALKGAANYASGLADSTYQNQANNYYQGANAYYQGAQNYNNNANTYYQGAQNYYAGQNNAYNKLYGIAGMGENAAATTGNLGQQSASSAANLLTGSGNAQAAGQIGSANALSSGLSGVGNSLTSAAYMNLLTNNMQGGGTANAATGGLNPNYYPQSYTSGSSQ